MRTIRAVRELCGDRVQIVVGASGDRALELVARFADEWNCGARFLDRIQERAERLTALVGERKSTLRRSVNMPIVLGPLADVALVRRYNLDLALTGDLDTMIERVRSIRVLGFDSIWLGGQRPETFERALDLLPHLRQL